MPNWDGSDRRSRLPKNWIRIKIDVKRRDSPTGSSKDAVCQWVRNDTGRKCLLPATDVDHIVNGDDHSMSNLQSLCDWHHKGKSGSEGGTASAAARKQKASAQKRHPGIIYDD